MPMEHLTLSKLRQEIEAFQQRLPASVSAISLPTAVAGILVDGEIIKRAIDASEDEGPWQATLHISGQSPCYSQPIVARVVFYADKPMPTVSFHTITYHKHTANPANAGVLPEAFYQELAVRWAAAKAKAPDGFASRLGAVVEQITAFFREPLSDCEEWTPSAYHEAILRAGQSMNIPEWETKSVWEKIAAVNQARNQLIDQYVNGGMCKHPELFQGIWKSEWLCPDLAAALECGDLSSVLREETPGVYSFPMLRPEFCEMLLEECDQYTASGLPIRRPNSMNNYGLILTEIGMEPLIDALQQAVLHPIANRLWHSEGCTLDRHHTFLVRYKPGEDLGLDVHTDDSDVTFNVCLGREFTGSGLVFCGMLGRQDHRQLSAIYHHEAGRCVVHLGRKRHGADDIHTGERINLIIWNVNDLFRRTREYTDESMYEQEGAAPDMRCLSFTHDHDIEKYTTYPESKAHLSERGWCPPEGKEHRPIESVRHGNSDV